MLGFQISESVCCLVSFNAHMSRGPFDRDVVSLYSAVAFKEGLLGGRRCVAPKALNNGGAVYAQPDSAGVKGWLPYCVLEASLCSYCLSVKDVRGRIK